MNDGNSFLPDSACLQLSPLRGLEQGLRAIHHPLLPNSTSPHARPLGLRACPPLPQTSVCHWNCCMYVQGEQEVWLGRSMFPTYHTVMRKCVPRSRLRDGTLLRVTEHQRLGKRRSLRWIQIRWIILHGRGCLPQQNSKVNSGGGHRVLMSNERTF